MATTKQVSYALRLLDLAGYRTAWMDASFKRLGATMRERSGPVREWLQRMEHSRISALIGELKTIRQTAKD